MFAISFFGIVFVFVVFFWGSFLEKLEKKQKKKCQGSSRHSERIVKPKRGKNPGPRSYHSTGRRSQPKADQIKPRNKMNQRLAKKKKCGKVQENTAAAVVVPGISSTFFLLLSLLADCQMAHTRENRLGIICMYVCLYVCMYVCMRSFSPK